MCALSTRLSAAGMSNSRQQNWQYCSGVRSIAGDGKSTVLSRFSISCPHKSKMTSPGVGML